MTRSTHRVAALALGLLLVAAAVGCGGTSNGNETAQPAVTAPPKTVTLGKTAYETTMRRLGRTFAGSVETMFPLTQGQPGTDASAQSIAKLEKTRAVVTNVTASISAITPPASIRDEHQRLLKGLSDFRDELDQLIQFLQKGGPERLGTLTRFAGLTTIAKARSAIESKGYAIG